MKNYKLTIQYDGTSYCGWQIQKNCPTIQQIITDSIQILVRKEINLIGSGRTDSGVHALGQVANFRIDEPLDLYKFKFSLNSVLPKDISVLTIEEVGEEFHARFDAKKRTYMYLFSKFKSPFYKNYSSHLFHKVNVENINLLTKALCKKDDFISFSKTGSDELNTICTIHDARWKDNKSFLLFRIEADRYLRGMVRAIVGTLLKLDKEKKDIGSLYEIISSKNRENAGFSVPAKGLFLYKVRY